MSRQGIPPPPSRTAVLLSILVVAVSALNTHAFSHLQRVTTTHRATSNPRDRRRRMLPAMQYSSSSLPSSLSSTSSSNDYDIASSSSSSSSSSPSSTSIPSTTTTSPTTSTRTTRREWIERSAFASTATLLSSVVSSFQIMAGHQQPAWAKYGDSSSMELPNYIEYLIEKNRQIDDSQVLYRGADPAVLLERLQDSLRRLNEIPTLANEKKWTQINGIVTGPLGTLSQTLNQIVTVTTASGPTGKKSNNTSKVQDAARKVKADVLAIGQAADKKNAEECTGQASLASQDLKRLLEIAFE